MGKKGRGLGNGKKLQKRRAKFRWSYKHFTKRALGVKEKISPLEGSPQARGIVLEKVQIEAKQPNSAMRKCVRVQLTKNGKQITAFAPGDKAITFINEHDEVLVEGLGGRLGKAPGDLSGVSWRVISVNKQPILMLRRGKIDKVVGR